MKQSRDGLINVSQLGKILKKADRLWWARCDSADIVSNGYLVVRADLIDRSALYQIFGREPLDGQVLVTHKYGRDWQSSEADSSILQTFEKFLAADKNCTALDTGLTADITDGHTVRLYDLNDTYVALNTEFWKLIADNEHVSVTADKVSVASPLVFRLGNETAVILPINYRTINKYLKVAG